MEIIVGKTAGFCYGVSNAVNKTREVLKNNTSGNIYCLGELVHNKQVVESLSNSGLKCVESVKELHETENKNDKVIIRAHGVSKDVYEAIKTLQYECVDLTCPNVLNIHKIVIEYLEKGYYILLIGQKNHPEVLGTYGWCDGNCSIIETEEDIEEIHKNLNFSKILVVGQTTFSLEKFNKFVEIIKSKFSVEIEVKNTICHATKLRQEETERLSKEVDLMIIIGGKNSSNTRKLYEISSKNTEAICIETADELEVEKIEIMKKDKSSINLEHKNGIEKIHISTRDKNFKIGIMAGASTPQKSIDDVVEKLDFLM